MTRRIDKFTADIGDLITVDCCRCTHKSAAAPTCDAFPNGIPKAILVGDLTHREHIEGDNGIKFEEIKEE